MSKIIKFFLDLIFPVYCLGCKKEGDWVCADCFLELKINLDWPSQFGKSEFLSGVWAVSSRDQTLLHKILHNFKYNFVVDLGPILGDLAVKFLQTEKNKNPNLYFDFVVAVPLSKKRKLWRGFNQAEIIAKSISQKFNWPQNQALVYRQYHTRPQVGLNAKDRQLNVKGIFSAKDPGLLIGKKILLIDDVFTTGATMNECAKVLKKLGAKEIRGLVLTQG
ncbi:MAG: ComF family protein [Candidatus Buchananbacteria bacterium]